MSDNRLIFDVGIHRGEDTAYYLKRRFRVVGIEADPEHAAYCRMRFTSEIARGQLVLLEGVIAPPSTDTISFHKNLDNPVWGTIDPTWVERNERRGTHHRVFQVARIDLNNCFERYGMPYYLKIDIEGADMLCVYALQRCQSRPVYLSLESEMKSFAGLKHEIDTLQSLGYDAFRAVQQADIPARTRRLALPHSENHTFEYGCSGPLPEEIPAAWQTARGVLNTYRKIFVFYRLLGTESWLWHRQFGRSFIQWLGKQVQGEMPGWYDTHARHASFGGRGAK